METSASFEARSAPLPYPTTGMELRMKEPHEKGVAIRSAPSFALDSVRSPVKRKQGKRWAGYRASKICNQGADAVPTAEATRPAALTRAVGRPCVVVDPMHVWKLHAREPGDLGDA